jgi:hypothetical protein
MQIAAIGSRQAIVLVKANGENPSLVKLLKVDVADI